MKLTKRAVWPRKKIKMYQNPRALHRAINLVCLLLIVIATCFLSNVKETLPETRKKDLPNDVEGTSLERVRNGWKNTNMTNKSPLAAKSGEGARWAWKGDSGVFSRIFDNDANNGAPRRVVIDYSNDKWKINKKGFETLFPPSFPRTPPNINFIFHNKLPKSGSSTMNNILKVLRKKNKFNFLKVKSETMTFYDKKPLANFIQSNMKAPYFLLKHHYWINFTEFHMKPPTFINVMRDPIEWFTSRYYFQRYGWNRKPGCRTENCGMTKEEFEMDIDDCVASSYPSCALPWMYIPFFCGATSECTDISTVEEKRNSLEIAKKRIVEDYYFVGILEQFEDTLRSLQLLLPEYFDGAMEAWKGGFVQKMRELTRTTYKKKMSRKSEEFFRNGPLKYEVELYEFARELFNRRLKSLGLKPTRDDTNTT